MLRVLFVFAALTIALPAYAQVQLQPSQEQPQNPSPMDINLSTIDEAEKRVCPWVRDGDMCAKEFENLRDYAREIGSQYHVLDQLHANKDERRAQDLAKDLLFSRDDLNLRIIKTILKYLPEA